MTEQLNNGDPNLDPNAPVSGEEGKTFTPDEVTSIVRDRLSRQKAQLERTLTQSSAEAAKSKVDLEATTTQLTRYQGAFKKLLEDKRSNLPEPVTKLLDQLDPLDQLEWIAENGSNLTQTFKPVPETPKPTGDSEKDQVQAKRRSSIYNL